MKIKELAVLINGVIEGSEEVDVKEVSGIESAGPGSITFAIDEDKLALAEKSAASCILTTKGGKKSSKPLIRVDNPKLSFMFIYNALSKKVIHASEIHPTAVIAKSARLGKDLWIGPHVSIGDDVTIGDNTIIGANSVIGKKDTIGSHCHIYPNVTLYENVLLKNRVILHSGVVVGADGFGYVKDKGEIHKFPQLGRVIIEDNVEVGANTTIDRGALCDTIIGAGTKIDNLCQVAHNVRIGRNTLIAAQCGISGSSVVEDDVTMGGQVGVADKVAIEKGAIIGAQSGVIGDIEKNTIVWGTPARPIAQTKRQMAVLAWLTKNIKRIQKLLGEDE